MILHESVQFFGIVLLASLLAHLSVSLALSARRPLLRGRSTWRLLFFLCLARLIALHAALLLVQADRLSARASLLIAVTALLQAALDAPLFARTEKIRTRVFLFLQLLHLGVLAAAALLITQTSPLAVLSSAQLSEAAKIKCLGSLAIYLLVVFGGGHLIRAITQHLAQPRSTATVHTSNNAGLYIGWIERSLVLIAIALGSPALAGLILTGKSIARFPAFSEARFAEYFLIGTLMSLLLAILGGVALQLLLQGAIKLM